jgi:hypothetical protein
MEYKISFCITCMNRLSHLQETLPKNIHDNYLFGLELVQWEQLCLEY